MAAEAARSHPRRPRSSESGPQEAGAGRRAAGSRAQAAWTLQSGAGPGALKRPGMLEARQRMQVGTPPAPQKRRRKKKKGGGEGVGGEQSGGTSGTLRPPRPGNDVPGQERGRRQLFKAASLPAVVGLPQSVWNRRPRPLSRVPRYPLAALRLLCAELAAGPGGSRLAESTPRTTPLQPPCCLVSARSKRTSERPLG